MKSALTQCLLRASASALIPEVSAQITDTVSSTLSLCLDEPDKVTGGQRLRGHGVQSLTSNTSVLSSEPNLWDIDAEDKEM